MVIASWDTWVFPGTPTFFHIEDSFALTSVPTKDIRTWFLTFVKITNKLQYLFCKYIAKNACHLNFVYRGLQETNWDIQSLTCLPVQFVTRKPLTHISAYHVDTLSVINVSLRGETGLVHYAEETSHHTNLSNSHLPMKMVRSKLLFRSENFIYLHISWNHIFFIFCVCCKADFL